MAYAASFLEWYAAEARRVYGETVEFPVTNRKSIIMKQPLGVAGIIVPVSSYIVALIGRDFKLSMS